MEVLELRAADSFCILFHNLELHPANANSQKHLSTPYQPPPPLLCFFAGSAGPRPSARSLQNHPHGHQTREHPAVPAAAVPPVTSREQQPLPLISRDEGQNHRFCSPIHRRASHGSFFAILAAVTMVTSNAHRRKGKQKVNTC